MAVWFDVRLDDPERLLDTFGAGAMLRWEASDDGGVTWSEHGTEALLATKRLHTIEYAEGDDETLFRYRISRASPAVPADYSDYGDVRPVVVPDVVATAGDESANSYLTVAEADVLAGEDIGPEPEKWLAAESREKAATLKRATREIDAYVATGWPPYDDDQALTFPREDIDVTSAGAAFIPQRIKLACYQQAIFILQNKDELAAVNAQRSRNTDADPDAAYGGDPGPSIMSPLALHYLSGFRTAPRPGKGGGIGSVRVASGFQGTW